MKILFYIKHCRSKKKAKGRNRLFHNLKIEQSVRNLETKSAFFKMCFICDHFFVSYSLLMHVYSSYSISFMNTLKN